MRKEKGKKKMSEYNTNAGLSDRSEFNGANHSDGGPRELRIDSARMTLKTANERLH